MKFLCLLFLLLFPYYSAADISLDNYGVGYGLLSSGVFTEAVTETGENSIYGSFSFHFLDANISWAHEKRNLRYHIKTAYTLLPRESEDGAVDISQWRISFLLGFEPKKKIRRKLIFTTGLGVLGTVSKGNGGTIVLNNGSGSTTFHRPSNTVHSKLLMLELGMIHQISKNINYSIDALVNGLFGDRRNLNIYMSINYYWDHGYKRGLKKAQRNLPIDDNDEFQTGEQIIKKKKKRKKRKKRRRKKTKDEK